MRFKMMALAAAVSFTVPTLAQTADPATSTPTPKPKKEKKICRQSDANSYSRMTPSICRTQAEWDRDGSTSSARAGVRSMDGENLPSR